jgi:CMP-N-acetylneuraminic acid synthetase
MKQKNLVAVIPIRKGSQRVKNKNLKHFFNEDNLLTLKLKTLIKINIIDDVVVNTDSEEAIEIAKKFNVSYHKRDDFFASSECDNSTFWSHIAKNTNSKFIMMTNCTSPFVKYETYIDIINRFELSKDSHDSINTATQVKEYLYKDNKPFNFKIGKTPNSQNLPDIYKLNFAINIIHRDKMIKNKSVIGIKPILYNLDEYEGFDIDTPFDFEFAKLLCSKI